MVFPGVLGWQERFFVAEPSTGVRSLSVLTVCKSRQNETCATGSKAGRSLFDAHKLHIETMVHLKTKVKAIEQKEPADHTAGVRSQVLTIRM